MADRPREEAALWRSAAAGSREAFACLLRDLLPPVRRFLARLGSGDDELDDLAQEVFVRVIEGIDRLRDPAKGRSWTLGIAATVFRERRRTQLDTAPLADVDSPDLGPLEEAADGELQRHARRAVWALPVALRQVLVMSLDQALAPTEIAEALQLSAGAVRHRLFRARQLVRDALQGRVAP